MNTELQSDKEEIAALFQYDSSKTGAGDCTNFTEYIDNMTPSQKDIYYVVSPSKVAADNSPYVEALKQLEYEVLYSYSEYDDIIFSHLREFKGKNIVSAEEYSLNNPNSLKLTSKEGQNHKDFVRWFENVLNKDVVKSVKISLSLYKQPAMITIKNMAQSRAMIRGKESILSWDLHDVTLHINTAHKLIINIDRLRQKNPELAVALAVQVYYNSMIAAGLITDVRSILHNINDLLVATTKEEASNTILTP